jgi:hypothetical protein
VFVVRLLGPHMPLLLMWREAGVSSFRSARMSRCWLSSCACSSVCTVRLLHAFLLTLVLFIGVLRQVFACVSLRGSVHRTAPSFPLERGGGGGLARHGTRTPSQTAGGQWPTAGRQTEAQVCVCTTASAAKNRERERERERGGRERERGEGERPSLTRVNETQHYKNPFHRHHTIWLSSRDRRITFCNTSIHDCASSCEAE